MSDIYEQCRSNLEIFEREFDPTSLTRNEATTRLQLIDRLFFDCLGWSRNDCISEESHAGEYADYTFLAPRRMLVVEAKREGNYFELPAGFNRVEYSIPGLARDNVNVAKALEQVAGYCQRRGIVFGAVANGHQVVAFIAIRQDGPPLEGRALVFPSINFMLMNFLELWNTLSKLGVQERWLESRLIGQAKSRLPLKLSSSISSYPGAKARNQFQTDLKIVSELVLEDVTNARELEPEFLRECYCESGALSEFSLISRDILQARYSALFDASVGGPSTEPAVTRKGITPELLAKSLSRRPILILGDVGVGKTSFLRHLMNVDALDQFANAVALHLDLGHQASLTTDLRVFVVEEVTRQLRENYQIDVEENSLVRATYHGELQRFSRGIYSSLRTSDPSLYAQKELEFLEAKLANRDEHLKHVLEHIERSRRKQIVIFLDNADQRDYHTQQQAFLIAQEFAATWPTAVFVTLRPETFHLSLRSGGTLSGYHPKAFTIAPPRVDRVIEKRLHFGLKLTRGELPIQALRAVNVQLRSLETILRAFLKTLTKRQEIGELIDNVAGGNVRLALELVQIFLSSGHVDTEKIVRIYSQSKGYYVPLHEFLRAVIYGDSVHYDPTRSYLANFFDIASADPKEHFILSLLLSQLESWTGPEVENGFVQTAAVYDRLQGMGYTPEQADSAFVRGLKHRLIETSARLGIEPGQDLPTSVRVTTVGAYHVERLLHLFAYIDAIVVDTPILDRTYREMIHDVDPLKERLARARIFCDYLDVQWQHASQQAGPFQWTHASANIRTDIQRIVRRQARSV